MKRYTQLILRFVLALVILSALISVAAARPNEYHRLTLDHTTEGEIVLEKEASGGSVSDIEVALRFVPVESYRQTVLQSSMRPEGAEGAGNVTFDWDEPASEELTFAYGTRVKTQASGRPVTEMTKFPLENIPKNITPYLQPTGYIDSSEEIEQLAKKLVQGKDDLFSIEAAFAEWVHDNIQYNLTTLTSDINQPASWVMEQRYGVCDEITNLFIAMNREIGVPARFVSGVAYSDLIEESDGWGNHGWAEVYFPKTGWVPFDVTYNQMGFVDATHIALQKSVDGNISSIEYAFRKQDMTITPRPLSSKTEMVSHSESAGERTEMELEMLQEKVGFGSYNVLTATLHNLKDRYVVEELNMHPTNNIKILTEDTRKMVALKPRETEEVEWIVKVEDAVDENYIYTFPLAVSRTYNTMMNTTFKVAPGEDTYSKAYVKARVDNIKPEESEAGDLDFDCRMESSILLLSKPQVVRCTVYMGNQDEYPYEVCAAEECEYANENNRTVRFTFEHDEPTVTTLMVTAESQKGTSAAQEYLTYEVIDRPKISLSNVELQNKTDYTEEADLEFDIEKRSTVIPEEVKVIVQHKLLWKEWDIPKLYDNKSFTLRILGSRLHTGLNEFDVRIVYEGVNATNNTVNATATTELVTDSFEGMVVGVSNQADVHIKTMFESMFSEQAEDIPMGVKRVIVYGVLLVLIFVFGKVLGSMIMGSRWTKK